MTAKKFLSQIDILSLAGNSHEPCPDCGRTNWKYAFAGSCIGAIATTAAFLKLPIVATIPLIPAFIKYSYMAYMSLTDVVHDHSMTKKDRLIESKAKDAMLLEAENLIDSRLAEMGIRDEMTAHIIKGLLNGSITPDSLINPKFKTVKQQKVEPTDEPKPEEFVMPDTVSLLENIGNVSINKIFLGVNELGDKVYVDFDKIYSMLILGAPDSGKSFLAIAIVIQLMLDRFSEPIIDYIDPASRTCPLLGVKYVSDISDAKSVLKAFLSERDERNSKLANEGVSKFQVSKNKHEYRPYVVIYDELLAHLLLKDKELTSLLLNCIRDSRAVNMKIILITQVAKAEDLDTKIRGLIGAVFQYSVPGDSLAKMVFDHNKAKDIKHQGRCYYRLPVMNQDGEMLQTPFEDESRIPEIMSRIDVTKFQPNRSEHSSRHSIKVDIENRRPVSYASSEPDEEQIKVTRDVIKFVFNKLNKRGSESYTMPKMIRLVCDRFACSEDDVENAVVEGFKHYAVEVAKGMKKPIAEKDLVVNIGWHNNSTYRQKMVEILHGTQLGSGLI